MANSSYWTRSPSPNTTEALANASYWESDFANTVYSTGKSPFKNTSVPTSANLTPSGESGTRPNAVRQLVVDERDPRRSNEEVDQPINNVDPRKRTASVPPQESRDPRRRKRSAEGKFKTEIPCREREPPPDRPDTITPQNIELHRLVHENDHEWGLRRRFLLEHCENLPSNQLECLSQVFVNVECLGSFYPREVMDRVRSLSSHMAQELDQLREKKKVKIEFVKAEENVPEKPKHKPIAFVKPNTGEKKAETIVEEPETVIEKETEEELILEDIDAEVESDASIEETENVEESGDVEEESGDVEETCEPIEIVGESSPKKKESRWKKNKTKYKAAGEPSEAMELFQTNKRLYARSKAEEMVYDLAHSMARIENENKVPKNPVEYLYMGASWAKLTLEFRFTLVARGQTCFVLVSAIVLGDSTESSKKQAKRVAFERAVEALKKPYLRVVRLNPERQELQASDRPFGGPSNVPKLAILGGGEVARRGMKTSIKAPREDFLLVDYSQQESNNAAMILQQSADFNKVPLKWDFEVAVGQATCRVVLDHEEFTSFTASTKQLAKINAAEQALEKLQGTNWTIKVKSGADSASSSGLSRDEVLCDLTKASDAIPESNIGAKMLKRMGWTGGGVGKSGQGIAEPVKADTTLVRREGFGLSAAKGLGRDFKTKVKLTLSEYCRSQRQDDMRFSPEFSNEERAIVHTEARKLGLRSRSYGQGEDRYLVVGRKRTPSQLLQHIMEQGGSTSKYDLVGPSSGQ